MQLKYAGFTLEELKANTNGLCLERRMNIILPDGVTGEKTKQQEALLELAKAYVTYNITWINIVAKRDGFPKAAIPAKHIVFTLSRTPNNANTPTHGQLLIEKVDSDGQPVGDICRSALHGYFYDVALYIKK